MGIALIISGGASIQQQALLTSFLVLMPAVMLSGFLCPISDMPVPIRYATVFNPMRWYLEILRGIVMKDVGIIALWLPIVAQSGCISCTSCLSSGSGRSAFSRFRPTLWSITISGLSAFIRALATSKLR